MPTIEANGQRLYYEEHGEGEPLLCVMGLAADIQAWMLQVPSFAAHHRTIVFDNRDVGRSSEAQGPYELSDMAADALALADALEIDRFHLLGVSMGGAIAQEMVLAAPERVRSLTLAFTWAGGGAWSRKLAEVWTARVERMTREQRVDELMLLTMSEAFFENAEAVAFARQMMLDNPHPQSAEAFARQLEASSKHNIGERLAAVTAPTHVIGAEHDILVPVWKQQELVALIGEAKLTVIEAAPHGAQLECAEDFNRAVLDFIAAGAAAPA